MYPRGAVYDSLVSYVQVRFAGFAESFVPAGGDDGTGLCPHRRDHVLRLRFRPCQGMRRKDGHDLQALFGAIVSTGEPPAPLPP